MRYAHLTAADYQSLATTFMTDMDQFKADASSIIDSTVRQYTLLFNEFPKAFLGISNKIVTNQELDIKYLQATLQKISTVQHAIKVKEEELQPDDKPQKENLKSNTNKTKTIIMENSKNFKATAINATDKVASAIFGASHFVFQSLADLTLETEGAVRSKLTGVNKDSIKENRELTTAQAQAKAVAAIIAKRKRAKDTYQLALDSLADLTETKSSSSATKLEPSLTSNMKHAI